MAGPEDVCNGPPVLGLLIPASGTQSSSLTLYCCLVLAPWMVGRNRCQFRTSSTCAGGD